MPVSFLLPLQEIVAASPAPVDSDAEPVQHAMRDRRELFPKVEEIDSSVRLSLQ
jgi:hypothetical protein